MRIDELERFGIDFKTGIARCANDESIYFRLLEAFLRDTSMEKAKEAFDSGDYEELFRALHELKGSSGNASMTRLYNATSPLVEALRGGNCSKDDVDRQFALVCSAYDKAREGVTLFIKDR